MNYLIIQNSDVPSTCKPPYNIIQMFTNEEIRALATFLEVIENDHGSDLSKEGEQAISRFTHLFKQWEDKTQ